jgi:hypothetical protein
VWTIDGFGVPCVEARRLAVDDRVRVEHVQSCGWLEMAALQYDNARAISGIRGLQSPRDWLRLLGAPWLAWARTLRVASVCRAKRLGGAVVACLPIVLVLFYAKAAGEVAGYLAGPGDSARRLH